MFVFVDTSVWIAAVLSARGASFAVLGLARERRIDIASSKDVFDEAVRNLGLKYPDRLNSFHKVFYLIRPTFAVPQKETILAAAAMVHADDAMILAAAIEADADALVTLDKKHFLNLPELETRVGFPIIRPEALLRWFE